jgi:SAM-dependent methyltransferase
LLIDGVEKKEIVVRAIDPLADIYSGLLQKYGIDYPIKPVKGYSENIGGNFAPSTFDIVYSSNALDHALSPGLCFRQIERATKPGGLILLEGFTNEGSCGNWHGLHQHDLYLEDNQLMHKSKSGKIANLSKELELKCLMAETCQFIDRGILSFGYEIPEWIKPENNWNFRDWYMITFRKAN